MRKQIPLYISILLIPIFLVVLVNEYSRLTSKEEGSVRKGITAINSSVKTPKKCSWYCHSDTGYCKKNHTSLLKNHFSAIDPLYFGIIKSLHSTGDYGLANIVFLVVLLPLFMYLLLVKSISIQRKIKKLKNG
ncbi:hypothetical protein ACSTS3_18700 [Aquimarina muelleri]|uniref:hypothetical protein n=1 Tax=Aquimarina muelleri TaxID=279356 RepID=UPI003F685744